MRKIGAHVSAAGGPLNALANALKMGANCFQIFAGSPRTWARSLYAESIAKDFNDQLLEQHLDPVFIHALYLINLASDNPETLENSFNSLLTDLQNGDQINSAGVIVHLGSHQGRGFDSVKDQLVSQINLLLTQSKMTNFVIENSAGQKGKIGTLDEIEILLKNLNSSRLKVCLDTAHLYQAGFDLNQPQIVDELIKELKTKNILDHLVCLHLNDSKTPLGSARDIHANLGDGFITLPAFEYLINHPQLKHLPLILETPGLDGKGPDEQNIKLTQSLIK